MHFALCHVRKTVSFVSQCMPIAMDARGTHLQAPGCCLAELWDVLQTRIRCSRPSSTAAARSHNSSGRLIWASRALHLGPAVETSMPMTRHLPLEQQLCSTRGASCARTPPPMTWRPLAAMSGGEVPGAAPSEALLMSCFYDLHGVGLASLTCKCAHY